MVEHARLRMPPDLDLQPVREARLQVLQDLDFIELQVAGLIKEIECENPHVVHAIDRCLSCQGVGTRLMIVGYRYWSWPEFVQYRTDEGQYPIDDAWLRLKHDPGAAFG